MNKNTLVSIINNINNVMDTGVIVDDTTSVKVLEAALPGVVAKLVSAVQELSDEVLDLKLALENASEVEHAEVDVNEVVQQVSLLDELCSAIQYTHERVSPLWGKLQVVKSKRGELICNFETAFYKANREACFAFIGRLKSLALKKGVKASTASGKLVITVK